ncbi:MAG: cystathionine gamma-synthase [Bacillota bacterium]
MFVRPGPASQGWRFETLAIHAGQPPEPATGAVVVPIYQTSTFAQAAPGVHKGYEYARTDNPTRRALEEVLAALEGGRYGLAFASGMAAISALGYTLRPGQRVLVPNDVYGGTWRFFHRVLGPWGIETEPVEMTDLAAVDAALRAPGRPPVGLVVIESPTNPTLKVLDIAAISALAHRHGVRVAVDNTFASPHLQSPLALGADLVIHSTTKYLGGHSDVVGGALITSDAELAGALRFVQNAAGGVPGPFDCWLVLRGIKTLAVRMERHCANAARVAEFLQAHPAVEAVHYPGLPHHPGHELARRQMRGGFGGMVSLLVKGGEAEARRVVSRTRVFTLGESLGGVESLIEHPASMTHLSLSGSPLQVDPRLVRLSVGIEHIDDLVDDLRQALEG